MIHLLDVNLLIALAWPTHTHHAAAHAWFGPRAADGWATCPITQCGFVRISSNPKIIPAAATPDVAVNALRQMIGNPHHVFWPDDVMFTDETFVQHAALKGHRQVTDLYLVALALRHGGALATADAALPSSLPLSHRRAVVVVA